MARYPKLVLEKFCKTPIQVIVESEEINEEGVPQSYINWNGYCNYQEKAKRIFEGNKVHIDVQGTCYIPFDFAPQQAIIPSGKVILNGMERHLLRGSKALNPDGTVNYVYLEIE